jgi:predicted MPP superfamily phosphohydrolase
MKKFILYLPLVILYIFGVPQEPRSQNSAASASPQIQLPMKKNSLRFAVIGDTGTGTNAQQQLADLLVDSRKTYPFEFVLMMGDNLYGGEAPSDYDKKFEVIYKKLLDDKVKFYATLGNHDNSNQRFYDHFNMNGKEYYSFKKGKALFLSLNSNYMDERQLKWLEEELTKSDAEWKICFFHHPLYSSGKKHGSDVELRQVLEPLLVKHGVNVVFAGHEHFYERIKPQKGIYHFISGAGGQLRNGDIKTSEFEEKGYDKDLSFMLIEIADDQLSFQVLSRNGKTVDSGTIMNQKQKAKGTAN